MSPEGLLMGCAGLPLRAAASSGQNVAELWVPVLGRHSCPLLLDQNAAVHFPCQPMPSKRGRTLPPSPPYSPSPTVTGVALRLLPGAWLGPTSWKASIARGHLRPRGASCLHPHHSLSPPPWQSLSVPCSVTQLCTPPGCLWTSFSVLLSVPT